MTPRSRVARATMFLLLLLGVTLRLRPYFANRSLWLDEAGLALNIIDRDFAGLLGPLAHKQAAPPGFLWAQRLMIQLFGTSEYALRAVPVVAALVALFVFWRLASGLLSVRGALLACAMFSISPFLIYFAVEAKQYSVDVAIAVMLWWAMVALKPRLDREALLAWALILALGAAAIWVSHPAIFIVGGFAFEAVIRALRRPRWRPLALRATVGVLWLGSFGALYLLALRFTPAEMYTAWQGRGAPLSPSSFGVVNKYAETVWTLSTLPLGTQVAQLVTLAAMLGVVALWGLAFRPLVWFASALALGWMASSLGHYPVATRLWLFFTPPMVLLTAAGIDEVWRRTRDAFPGLGPIFVCLILLFPAFTTAREAVHSRQSDEIRPLLSFVLEHYRDGDVLYINELGQFAMQYYAARGLKFPGRIFVGTGTTTAETDAAQLRGHARVWVLFSHADVSNGINEEQFFVRMLDRVGARVEQRQETGASVYLYNLSDVARPARLS